LALDLSFNIVRGRRTADRSGRVCAIARALDADPLKLFREFLAGETSAKPAPKPRKSARWGGAGRPYRGRFLPEHCMIVGTIRATRLLDIRSTSGASGAVLRPVLGRTSWTAHLSNAPSSAFPPQAHMLELCNVLEERNAETLSSSGLHRCCAGVTDPFFPDLASAGEEMSCRARGAAHSWVFFKLANASLRTTDLQECIRPRRVVPIKPNLCPLSPENGSFPGLSRRPSGFRWPSLPIASPGDFPEWTKACEMRAILGKIRQTTSLQDCLAGAGVLFALVSKLIPCKQGILQGISQI
jgi:hypothetical protein